MSSPHSESGYKVYWKTWGILLGLTAAMLITEVMAWPKIVIVALLLMAMLVKASFIGGEFMHLRFERPILTLTIAGSILFFCAFLFILIAFDGLRIFKMVTSQ